MKIRKRSKFLVPSLRGRRRRWLLEALCERSTLALHPKKRDPLPKPHTRRSANEQLPRPSLWWIRCDDFLNVLVRPVLHSPEVLHVLCGVRYVAVTKVEKTNATINQCARDCRWNCDHRPQQKCTILDHELTGMSYPKIVQMCGSSSALAMRAVNTTVLSWVADWMRSASAWNLL